MLWQRGYLAAPMRQIVVPQSGHLPFVIGLPFFVVPSTGSFMIFFALHFTQYASIAIIDSTSLSYPERALSNPVPFVAAAPCLGRMGLPL